VRSFVDPVLPTDSCQARKGRLPQVAAASFPEGKAGASHVTGALATAKLSIVHDMTIKPAANTMANSTPARRPSPIVEMAGRPDAAGKAVGSAITSFVEASCTKRG